MDNIQKSIVIYSILSYLIFAAACLQKLSAITVLILLVLSLLAILPLRRIRLDAHVATPMTGRQTKLFSIALVILFLFFAHVFIIPPYMRDDVIYHLLVPKQLFADGGFGFDPYNINSNFPMVFELPLVLTFLAEGWGSPFFANYLVLLGLCTSFYLMAVRVFEIRHTIALPAVLLMATTPVVYDQVRSCYVELFMSLLVLLTFYNYFLFRSDRSQSKFWYLTMMFAGLLCATKYTGGVFVIFILAVEFFSGKDRGLYYRGALISVTACLPWYLKNWIQLGNPVFPLLGFLFPSEFVSVERSIFYKHLFADYHAGRSLTDYLLLPWRLLTGYAPPVEAGRLGFGGKLSLFLIFAYASIAACFQKNDLSPLSSFKKVVGLLFLCCAVFWIVTSHQVRFLLPVFILAALSGLSVVNTHWRRLKLPAIILFGLVLVQNIVNIGSTMNEEKITGLVSGQLSQEQFLNHHMPISHRMAAKLNQLLNPENHRLLAVGNFGRNYYYDVQVLTNTYYEAEILANAFKTDKVEPGIFESFVRKERITHLLLNHAYLKQFFSNNPSFDMVALNRYLARLSPILVQKAVVVYDLKSPHEPNK